HLKPVLELPGIRLRFSSAREYDLCWQRGTLRVLRKVFLVAFALFAASGAIAQEFNACVGKLRSEALGKGITAQIFDTALSGIEPDQSVLDSMDYQPEFKTPIWDYLAGLVDEERVADGQAKLAEWAVVLAQ